MIYNNKKNNKNTFKITSNKVQIADWFNGKKINGKIN